MCRLKFFIKCGRLLTIISSNIVSDEKYFAILTFTPVHTFLGCYESFSPGFQKTDSNVHWHSFLHIFCAWNLLIFWICGCIVSIKCVNVSGSIYLNTFSAPLPSSLWTIPVPGVFVCLNLSHSSLMLFTFLFSLAVVCFVLGSFYS